jgi:hypothetical protein
MSHGLRFADKAYGMALSEIASQPSSCEMGLIHLIPDLLTATTRHSKIFA